MRGTRLLGLIALSLGACTTEPPPAVFGYCAQISSDSPPMTNAEALETIFDEVRAELYPELSEVTIDLETFSHETDFFVANLDILTLADPPLERRYAVRYNERILDDPPSAAAMAGVMAHELKHILDYSTMDFDEINEFFAWYVTTDDFSEYERETDEHTLRLGCGLALREYRQWLYEHIPPEAVEQKRRDYYTPEEIDAWLASQNG